MAEEGFLNLNLPIDQFIQCIHCPETTKIYDVNWWPLSSVNEYLIGISDRVAGCEYLDEYYFDTANVPCVISCPYCAEDIETVAQVTALPVWNHEEISEGRVPSILNFEDIVVLKVSMLFEKTTSIKECFKCDKGIENPEDFELNEFIAEDTLDSDVVPKSIVLRIIAKTTMSTRYCYLGLHESTGRIYRPIFNTFDHKCGWPSNEQLEFCMLYMFSVVANPDEKKYFTPLPHCNEDMIVSGFTILEPKVTSMNTVYKSLLQVAKSDVRDVFKDIKSRSYVEEQTDCSSAGVIRSEAMIKFDDYMGKYYCHIRCPSGPYSFPITASEYHNIGAEYGDAVIVLGLGRPYKGRKRQHKTARCIVLAVGIYSPNVQMTLVL